MVRISVHGDNDNDENDRDEETRIQPGRRLFASLPFSKQNRLHALIDN